MTYKEFIASVESDDAPADGLPETLKSLWHAEKGDWEASHTIAQNIPTPDGSWIHANLHREEGDIGNARYWYVRAGKPESHDSVAEEREQLIRAMLDS